jgi:hypothetical protein
MRKSAWFLAAAGLMAFGAACSNEGQARESEYRENPNYRDTSATQQVPRDTMGARDTSMTGDTSRMRDTSSTTPRRP